MKLHSIALTWALVGTPLSGATAPDFTRTERVAYPDIPGLSVSDLPHSYENKKIQLAIFPEDLEKFLQAPLPEQRDETQPVSCTRTIQSFAIEYVQADHKPSALVFDWEAQARRFVAQASLSALVEYATRVSTPQSTVTWASGTCKNTYQQSFVIPIPSLERSYPYIPVEFVDVTPGSVTWMDIQTDVSSERREKFREMQKQLENSNNLSPFGLFVKELFRKTGDEIAQIRTAVFAWQTGPNQWKALIGTESTPMDSCVLEKESFSCGGEWISWQSDTKFVYNRLGKQWKLAREILNDPAAIKYRKVKFKMRSEVYTFESKEEIPAFVKYGMKDQGNLGSATVETINGVESP